MVDEALYLSRIVIRSQSWNFTFIPNKNILLFSHSFVWFSVHLIVLHCPQDSLKKNAIPLDKLILISTSLFHDFSMKVIFYLPFSKQNQKMQTFYQPYAAKLSNLEVFYHYSTMKYAYLLCWRVARTDSHRKTKK